MLALLSHSFLLRGGGWGGSVCLVAGNIVNGFCVSVLVVSSMLFGIRELVVSDIISINQVVLQGPSR